MLALTGSKLKPQSERGTGREGDWVDDWATAWGLATLGSPPLQLNQLVQPPLGCAN